MRRSLCFQAAVLGGLAADPDAKMGDLVRAAYEAELEPCHAVVETSGRPLLPLTPQAVVMLWVIPPMAVSGGLLPGTTLMSS